MACLRAYVVLRLIPWWKVWLSITDYYWLLIIIDYWLWLVCLRTYVVHRLIPGSMVWSVFCQQWFLLMSGRLWWYENMMVFDNYIIFTGERHCVGPMVAGLRACRHICWKSHSELIQYHQKTNNTVSRVLYNTAADFLHLMILCSTFETFTENNWNSKEWELTLVPHSQRHQDRKNSPSRNRCWNWWVILAMRKRTMFLNPLREGIIVEEFYP